MSKIRILELALLAGLVFSSPLSAQSLLPNGQQTFTDSNGDPLTGGSVYFYVPGTTTAKYTYQDPGETVPNTNPIVLNAAGRAIIWGTGEYREVVYDQFGTLIWDQLTYGAAQGSASSGTGLHTQVFTASGTFTTPLNTTSSTIFEFCGVGAGGGGGGATNGTGIAAGGGGGGSGACLSVRGFQPGDVVTVGLGTHGVGGANIGGNGGNGTDTTLTYRSVVFMTYGYGGGGDGATSTVPAQGGGQNDNTVLLTGTGLTQTAYTDLFSQQGWVGFEIGTQGLGGAGGSTWLQGGSTVNSTGGVVTDLGPGGGGGSGAIGDAGASVGGDGGDGEVIVKWGDAN